jgi:glycosyltransferase involved in cell wall biosynthesis
MTHPNQAAAGAPAVNERKRLLVLAPRLPYPVVGGDRLRIHRVCRELARSFDLTLLALCETREEAEGPLEHDGVFSRIERVHLPWWRSWLSCLAAVPTRTPLQVAYYRSTELRRRVEALVPEHDGVLAHLIRTGEYVRDAKCPRFMEMTDVISRNYERVRAVRSKARRLQSLVYAFEARRLRRYERAVVKAFDLSVLVSDVDRRSLFPIGEDVPEDLLVCSNGVDAAELPYRFERDARDVAFIGNMASVQNMDAALFFATEVLPLVRARAPDVRFRVIGRIRAGEAARLAAHDGVDVTGEVASVPAAARGCGVGVCSLRLGAGVQNKVLEYMALGLPSVTTTVGLEGLEARPGIDILAADGAEALAAAVLELLSDRDRAEAIAASARAYVQRAHSWSARLAPMLDAISGHIGRPMNAATRPPLGCGPIGSPLSNENVE